MRIRLLAITLLTASCASAEPSAPSYHLISGAVPLDKGPDGNTIILDAPDGLIVVDAGRHPEHSAKILAHARGRDRPIVAIVNTHWHLDHTTGNADILRAFPKAEIVASRAVDGRLFRDFSAKSRAGAEEFLKSGKADPAQRAEIERGFVVLDNLQPLRATIPVERSTEVSVAGRKFDVRLASYAATEGDVWLYDPKVRVAMVGDLVVDIVPFMDTACADGWLRALDEIEKTSFETLIPGHGPVMDRAAFGAWKTAFVNFLACGRSQSPGEQCVAGWERDAGRFIDDAHRKYVREAAKYYIDTRLRSSAEEQQRYCKPLRPAA